jgi:hypothetical protein
VDDYRETCGEVFRRLDLYSAPLAPARLLAAAPGGLPALAGAWGVRVAGQPLPVVPDSAPLLPAILSMERSAVVRACLMRPEGVADPDRLLAVVPATDPVSRGAVLCRAGRHEEAARLLVNYKGPPFALLYLALAEHGRHRPAEAKKALEEAVRWLDGDGGVLESKVTNAGRLRWDWRLETELLRREVQALLEGK